MAKKSHPQISLTLYTLRDFTQNPAQIARTLRRVRRIGYQTVQISGGGLMQVEPPELKKMADDAGVAIIGSHIGLGMMREDLGKVVATLHAWDCRYAAIPHLPREEWQGPNGWKKIAREMTAIGRKLAKEGIKLQYHNHHFEFNRVGVRNGRGGKLGLEILFDNSDPKYLQSELDMGWVARAGADIALWVKRLKGRMDQVHVKDWGIVNRDPVWMPVGEGNINWKQAFAACKAIGVKHYIVEQDDCPTTKDPFRAVQISYENMRALGLR